jgi:hypothetical protein
LPDSWHLNYIAVLPEYQGCGIGRELWEQWIHDGREGGYTRLSLDVEHDNHLALDWYQRRGLYVTGRTWKYEKNIDPAVTAASGAARVRLVDWELAEASQLAYGFSQFRLVSEQKVWVVGRLGKRYFRVNGVLPQVLEKVLADIDPARRMLILSSAPLESLRLDPVELSIRLEGSL